MPMAQGFWARSPRIHQFPAHLKNTFIEVTSILMRAMVQDRAPSTYYGHWLGKNAGKPAAK